MENLTPLEICGVVVGVLLALATFINTVGSAWEKIAKARKAVQEPNDRQDERLAALEERMDEVERKQRHDSDHFANLDSGNRVTQRALLALLDHGIDGNNIEQMQHAKEELQTHLINR